MDIAALAGAMALSNTQNAWGVGMLSKTLDNSKSQGDQLVQMIEAVPASQMELSVNLMIGSNFDIRV